MAFGPAIHEEPANMIFKGVTFQKATMGGKTVGWYANYRGTKYEHASLTALCGILWEKANEPK